MCCVEADKLSVFFVVLKEFFPNMTKIAIGINSVKTKIDFTLVFLKSEIIKRKFINFKKMNIKPLADRVLVKPVAAEEKTISGIIIPDSAKEKPLKGEVLAVGNGTKEEEMVVAVGNIVLFGKYAGQELEWEGEKYLIMKQSDILAIV
jgi:chaperonin GroES